MHAILWIGATVCLLAALAAWKASHALADFHDQSGRKLDAVFAATASALLVERVFFNHWLMNWLAFTWAGVVGLALLKECIGMMKASSRIGPITGAGAAFAVAGAVAAVL